MRTIDMLGSKWTITVDIVDATGVEVVLVSVLLFVTTSSGKPSKKFLMIHIEAKLHDHPIKCCLIWNAVGRGPRGVHLFYITFYSSNSVHSKRYVFGRLPSYYSLYHASLGWSLFIVNMEEFNRLRFWRCLTNSMLEYVASSDWIRTPCHHASR